MDDRIRNLIFEAIDGSISPADFDLLQSAIEHDEEVRTEYSRAVGLTESLSEIAATNEDVFQSPCIAPASPSLAPESRRLDSQSPDSIPVAPQTPSNNSLPRDRVVLFAQLTIAATILLLASGLGFWLGQRNDAENRNDIAELDSRVPVREETRLAGHATLRRALDVDWGGPSTSFREGDVLPEGLLAFASGVVEVDFFCGANLIVEGPAQLLIESDWTVQVEEGRIRAHVPPAARGFTVKAAGSEIIDLGTEFALVVSTDEARVEVLDGEIELRGGGQDGRLLTTGERTSLTNSTGSTNAIEGLSTIGELLQRRESAEERRILEWKNHTEQVRQDERLIAYFPIASFPHETASRGRVVQNVSISGSESDGHLIGGVEWVSGRFGATSAGLEFDRPGSRVRTRIEGEFQAYTFACWAKIDSLEHRYNALFMADSYQNGEPHWQVRDDGCLMFSVMVDDTQQIQHFSSLEKRMVTQAGLHRVYYSKPIWDLSKSGQWFHLAAVYDPETRQVRQYVNGELVSHEEIDDKFLIRELKIGPSEIGNWGQPFRKTPSFAIRNLNGTIDEMAIFNAALSSEEIKTHFEQGKPLGY